MPNITIKKTIVDAMQYNHPASEELRDWIGSSWYTETMAGERMDRYHSMTFNYTDRNLNAMTTTVIDCDYIIQHDDGTFSVLPAEFFEGE